MHPIVSIQLGKIRGRDLAHEAACRRTRPRRRRLPVRSANSPLLAGGDTRPDNAPGDGCGAASNATGLHQRA